MKKINQIPVSIKWITAGAVTLLFGYLVTLAIPFEFSNLINYTALGLTALAIILSGTAVSGDRMRANNYSSSGEKMNTMKYSKYILLFAVPFYIMFVVLEFI